MPADAVLISGNYLQVDQAALTGESLPVNKQAGELVYDNSIVKMGEMEAVVTETGMNTYFGKSASLVIKAGKQMKSHFRRAVMKIGNGLIILTAFLAIDIIIFRQDPIMDVIRFVYIREAGCCRSFFDICYQIRRKTFLEETVPFNEVFYSCFFHAYHITIIAVFGIFLAPVSWQDIGYIWIYATVWFILNDSIKVWTYKLLRRGGILKIENDTTVEK